MFAVVNAKLLIPRFSSSISDVYGLLCRIYCLYTGYLLLIEKNECEYTACAMAVCWLCLVGIKVEHQQRYAKISLPGIL